MAYPIRDVVLPAVLSGRTNGKLPAGILVATPGRAGGPVVTLVSPAARAWRALEVAAAAAGVILQATSTADSYRSYVVQERTFRERYTTSPLSGQSSKVWNGTRWYQRPGTAMAAVPGTSNHGLAIAVDVANASGGRLAWLLGNAERYGWSWELQSEPWHIRYVAGDAIPAAVLSFEEDEMAARLDKDGYIELDPLTRAQINNAERYLQALAAVADEAHVSRVVDDVDVPFKLPGLLRGLAAEVAGLRADVKRLQTGGVDQAALAAAVADQLAQRLRD